jgi:hypothetical protein
MLDACTRHFGAASCNVPAYARYPLHLRSAIHAVPLLAARAYASGLVAAAQAVLHSMGPKMAVAARNGRRRQDRVRVVHALRFSVRWGRAACARIPRLCLNHSSTCTMKTSSQPPLVALHGLSPMPRSPSNQVRRCSVRRCTLVWRTSA